MAEDQLGRSLSILTFAIKYILCIVGILLIFGCSRKSVNTSSIIINSNASNSKKVSTQAGDWSYTVNPSSITDIICYAVSIEGPDLNSTRSCKKTDNSVVLQPSVLVGTVAANNVLTAEVTSGANRKITLIGFGATSLADCTSFDQLNRSNVSAPYIIATKTVNLTPGDNVIEMIASFDSTKEFDSCGWNMSAPPFNPSDDFEGVAFDNISRWQEIQSHASLTQTGGVLQFNENTNDSVLPQLETRYVLTDTFDLSIDSTINLISSNSQTWFQLNLDPNTFILAKHVPTTINSASSIQIRVVAGGVQLTSFVPTAVSGHSGYKLFN